MERARRPAAAMAMWAAAAAANAAEPACTPQDTITVCWERFLPVHRAAAQAAATTQAAHASRESLKKFETGLDGGAAPLATTTRNFLPLLSMAGLVSDSDGNAEDNLFTVDLNFLIPTLGEDRNAQLKAVLNTQPALFTPLNEALKTAGGGGRAAELQSQLDAGDDYTIALTYNHINERFGRSFTRYRQRFADLFEAAGTLAAAEQRERSGRDPLIVLISQLGDDVDVGGPMSQKAGLLQAVENAARSEAALEQQLRTTAAVHALSAFAELVNNQPQLTFGVEFRERDHLVGAREQSLKVAYEFGFANIGEMERTAGPACNRASADRENAELAAECLSRYRLYVERHADTLRNADRFVAALSYVDIGDYDYRGDGVVVERGGSQRLDASLGYGRTLRALGADRDSRLDLVAKYEDYSDDPDRRDRFLTTLTFTTKLNGVAVPIALVYANHGEFLPDVDEELSAHVGLKFALDDR